MSTKCQYNRNYATYSEQIGAAGPNLRKLLDMLLLYSSFKLLFTAVSKSSLESDVSLPFVTWP